MHGCTNWHVEEVSTDLLVLQSQFVVELLEVLPEFLLPIPSAEGDLKHLVAGRKCCQSGKALTTTPPHTHQQGVALVHTNHPGVRMEPTFIYLHSSSCCLCVSVCVGGGGGEPVDPGKMLQSIVK